MPAKDVRNNLKPQGEPTRDNLIVSSVEKAFRVLTAFDETNSTLSLTQLAVMLNMDKSAVQRFTHTLVQLGMLAKDPATKRFELAPRTLEFSYRYARSNVLVRRAAPYLLHLSRETDETVSLTIFDDTDIVFVARYPSQHVLSTDVIIGSRLPAYCTSSGVAMLSKLPPSEADAILERSDLRPITAYTTWRRADLLAKLARAGEQGYATASNEYFLGDLSIAAPVLSAAGRPIGAVTIGSSVARYTPEEAEARFAPLIIAAAQSIA